MADRVALAHASAAVPVRPTVSWLLDQPECSQSQYRSQLRKGGTPVFALDTESTEIEPVWVLLLRSSDGQIWRVRDPKDAVVRKLKSVRQVYKAARVARVTMISFPVDLGQK